MTTFPIINIPEIAFRSCEFFRVKNDNLSMNISQIFSLFKIDLSCNSSQVSVFLLRIVPICFINILGLTIENIIIFLFQSMIMWNKTQLYFNLLLFSGKIPRKQKDLPDSSVFCSRSTKTCWTSSCLKGQQCQRLVYAHSVYERLCSLLKMKVK